jgi:hypothetical protein
VTKRKSRHSGRALGSASLFLVLAGCAEAGTPGIDGADGAYADEKVSCVAVADGLLFSYEVVDFSNGDVWASCSVSDPYVEAEDSVFYIAGQNGAANASCLVTMDATGEPTAGYWQFAISGADVTATYNDAGDVNDGYVLTFLASECTLVER